MTTHKNSRNAKLLALAVGERFYVETTPAKLANTQRMFNTPKSRRPEVLKGCEFTATALTAISCNYGEAVRYLVCIERVL